jgi:hypothetical protein
MVATTFRRILVSALIACAPLAAGCTAEVESPGEYDGYTPMFHDGRVVYYDQAGAPYYYNGGRTVYVERSHPYYGRYETHYRTYGPRYQNWYRARGYRYHGYYRR